MLTLPEIVETHFHAAGWFMGRRVAVSSCVPVEHPAHAILAECGGLKVMPERNAGEECATSDLVFQYLKIDDSMDKTWDELLCTRLIGIGLTHRKHCELLVADDGRCFGQSMVDDTFCFVGESIGAAVERLLFGRRTRPMLRPDQSSVELYGLEFTHDNPAVYRYR